MKLDKKNLNENERTHVIYLVRLGKLGFLETATVVGNLLDIFIDKDGYVSFKTLTAIYSRW